MLNVIALRPVARTVSAETKTSSEKPLRHHVLVRTITEKAGRLSFAEDVDIEIPALDIYAAR